MAAGRPHAAPDKPSRPTHTPRGAPGNANGYGSSSFASGARERDGRNIGLGASSAALTFTPAAASPSTSSSWQHQTHGLNDASGGALGGPCNAGTTQCEVRYSQGALVLLTSMLLTLSSSSVRAGAVPTAGNGPGRPVLRESHATATYRGGSMRSSALLAAARTSTLSGEHEALLKLCLLLAPSDAALNHGALAAATVVGRSHSSQQASAAARASALSSPGMCMAGLTCAHATASTRWHVPAWVAGSRPCVAFALAIAVMAALLRG